MKHHLPLFGLAAAFRLSVSSLLLLAVVLVCPLVMLFMMRGMHGGAARTATTPGVPRGLDEDWGGWLIARWIRIEFRHRLDTWRDGPRPTVAR